MRVLRPDDIAAVAVPELRHGDIVLFMHDGTLGGEFIELWTHSLYHHVALYEGDGTVIEAMPDGVRRAPLGTRPVTGIRLRLKASLRHAAMAWATAQIGTPYNFGGMVWLGLERLFPVYHTTHALAHRFTCAVFVAEAYWHAGIELLPTRPWQELLPSDFAALLRPATNAPRAAVAHMS